MKTLTPVIFILFSLSSGGEAGATILNSIANFACAKLLLRSSDSLVEKADTPTTLGYQIETVRYRPLAEGEIVESHRVFMQKDYVKKGTVIHFRAGSASSVLSSHWRFMQPLVEEGYDIIELAYKAPKNSSQRKKLDSFLDSYAHLITKVIEKYKTEGSSIILYGQSLGGYFLLKVLSRLKLESLSMIDHIVIESSFTNLRTISQHMEKKQGRFLSQILFKLGRHTPHSWDLKSGELNEISIPTLILGGLFDSIIPISESKIIHNEINGSILEVINSSSHLFGAEDKESLPIILNFLNRYSEE